MADADFDYLSVDPALRAELTALCTEYVWRVDNGHAATVPELFTENAEWLGPWGTMRGHAELQKAWDTRAQRTVRTRHMLTNLRFIRQGPDHAQGQISQIVFAADGDDPFPTQPTLIAESHDSFARGPDGVWRFASRRIDLLAGTPL